jgi:hypothetical protein
VTGKEFADAVARVMVKAVESQGQTHPEDVMATMSLLAESIYLLTQELPSGAWNLTKVKP